MLPKIGNYFHVTRVHLKIR